MMAWTRDRKGFDPTAWKGVNAVGLKISLDHQNAGDAATRNYQSGLLVISA